MTRTHLLRGLGFAGALSSVLDRIPALQAVASLGSLTFIAEDWEEDIVHISALLTLPLSDEIQLWDLTIGFGAAPTGTLTVPLSFTAPARPMRTVLLSAAWLADAMPAQAVIEALHLKDINSLDDLLDSFSGDYSQLAMQVGPLPLRLTLATDLLIAGRHVRDAQGHITGVEPIDGAARITLALGAAQLRIDAGGIDVDLLGTPRLELPPLMLAGTALGIELHHLTLKLSDGPLPPAMAGLSADDGFDEHWRGVFASTITLWNLDKVFPGGPTDATGALPAASLQASALAIDGRGLTGKLSWLRPSPPEQRLALETLDLHFDRSWYPAGAAAEGQLDLADLGAAVLRYRAALEFDPFADPDARWRCDISLISTDSHALLQIDAPTPALAGVMGAAAATLGDTDAALLLAALAAGQLTDVLDFKRLSLHNLTLQGSLSPTGLTLDIDLALQAALDITALAEPVPLTLGSGQLQVRYTSTDGFDTRWSLTDGLELVLPLEVDIAGLATLERIALLRRSSGHLALELGMAQDGSGDLVIGALPDVISLVYDPIADRFLPPQFKRDSQELTLLVPGTLYAKGMLRRSATAFPAVGSLPWGETLSASLSVYLIGNGKASTPADHLDKNCYLYALDLGLLTATRQDGLQALVLTGDLSFRPGLPLGTSGVALYGLGLTYAQNAEPAASDGDYPDWFLRQAPTFSTYATKWQPQAGHWGFGASVTLGSHPDDGRAWNVAAGLFLLLPGPVVMITGKGSLFAPPPQLPSGGEGASVSAPFVATLALDLHRDAFTAELNADLKVGAAGKNLLELAIPARVEASLSPPVDMELSVGRFMPLDARVKGKALGLYDISAYIMVSTRGLRDFPRDGLHLPPFAIAYGGSGGLSAGFSSAIAELKLKVHASFDLGVSLASPPLMVGQLGIDGALIARIACIGINIGVHTDLLVVAPDPFELSGRATLRINLPWPIPDLRFSGSFRIGATSRWPQDYPAPADPIAQVSLFPRPNGTAVLFSGDSFDAMELDERGSVQGVPVDAGILIAFRAPMGNDQPTIGLISTQADDSAAPVWEVASSGHDPEGRELRVGWRHVLRDVQLREAGRQSIAAKAGWGFNAACGTTDSSANTANGGQGDRRELHLLAPLDAPVERRYGSGAEVLSHMLEGWRPCDPPIDQKSLLVSYTVPVAAALGIQQPSPRLPQWLPAQRWLALQRHGLSRAADVRIHYEPALPHATSMYPLHDIAAPQVLPLPAGISLRATGPLAQPERLLTVPCAVFTRQRDAEQAHVLSAQFVHPAGRLLIDFPGDVEQQFLYFLVRSGVQLDLRDANNHRLTAIAVFNGTLSRGAGEVWQLMQLTVPAQSLHISAAASMARVNNGEFFGTQGAVLVGASYFLPHQPQQAANDRQRTATVELIEALAEDASGWANGRSAGLLKPDTEYELIVQVDSHPARQRGGGALELADSAVSFTRRVRFRTEPDIAQPLMPRLPAAPWAPDTTPPWNVDTVPARDQYLYRADPVEVQFSDAVSAGRIAAHGRALQLQLEHESGAVLAERAQQVLVEAKQGFSELQDLVARHIEQQPCLSTASPLWLSLRQRFSTLLEAGRYRATLLAVDARSQRQTTTLHEWRLYASRWLRFADHVQAHDVQILPQPGIARTAAHQAGSALEGGHQLDEALLEAVLYDTLGHAPMAPASTPVLRVVLREDGCGWLLLDGPEPLLDPQGSVQLLQHDQPVALSGLCSNAARTRSLLCLTTPAVGEFTLHLRQRGQDARLTFTVPALSQFLESP